MKPWHLRIAGLALILVGSYLFVLAVRDLSGEGLRMAVGLAAVFGVSFGFGLLVLPWDEPAPPPVSETLPGPGKEAEPQG